MTCKIVIEDTTLSPYKGSVTILNKHNEFVNGYYFTELIDKRHQEVK